MWYANAIGYIFAVLVGDQAIKYISDRMWERIGWTKSAFPDIRPDVWQPRLTGIVERVLFVATLQVEQGAFIGIWLALKTAGQWTRWSKEPQPDQPGPQGRSIYQNFLIGNALSVLYALIGFKLIQWVSSGDLARSLLVSSILTMSTFVLWWLLGTGRTPETKSITGASWRAISGGAPREIKGLAVATVTSFIGLIIFISLHGYHYTFDPCSCLNPNLESVDSRPLWNGRQGLYCLSILIFLTWLCLLGFATGIACWRWSITLRNANQRAP